MNSRNTPLLETERLQLRQFTGNDIEAIFSIFGDEEVNTYLPWFPLKSMEDARDFYNKRYADAYRQPIGYQYAICLKNTSVPIGYVNVSTAPSHDLGYGLRKEFWHKSIAAEAAGAVLKQVKNDGFLYVTATHDIKNPRSGGVMKQLGMHYQYTYEEQWKPKNIRTTFRLYQLNFDGQDDRVYKEYWNTSAVHFIETDV